MSEWQPIASAPRDGTMILVDFGRIGVHAVAWTCPENSSFEIWCVDDRKFGPYPLRGYIETDVKAWMHMPLPDPPKEENLGGWCRDAVEKEIEKVLKWGLE